MTRWTLAGLLVALFGLLLTEIPADMIGPRRPGFPPVRPLNPLGGAQPNPVRVKLVVKVDENAKQAILQVPSNLARGQLIDTQTPRRTRTERQRDFATHAACQLSDVDRSQSDGVGQRKGRKGGSPRQTSSLT